MWVSSGIDLLAVGLLSRETNGIGPSVWSATQADAKARTARSAVLELD